MPTAMRIGPYRFYFHAADGNEPPHVHIQRENRLAKFWLKPVRLASSLGVARVELERLEKITFRHRHELEKKWDAFFDSA